MANNGEVRGRRWCFTWNNPTKTGEELSGVLNQVCKFFVFQKEKGEQGTEHFQGYLEYASQRKFRTVKAHIHGTCHLEKAKGNQKACVVYCTKQDTRIEGPWTNQPGIVEKHVPIPVADPLEGKELLPWQNMLTQVLEDEPDPRKIYWIWEETGGVGKTTFAKSLCIRNKKCIYVGGKANDVKCAIGALDIKPTIVLWDVPRSAENYVSYAGMEQVKNGIFFSGKYESAMFIMNNPHVVVFANFEPDRSKLSGDRWVVWHVPDAHAEPVVDE